MSKLQTRIFFSITLLILIFMAVKSEWSYDEAWAYLQIQNTSLVEIIKYERYHTGNNHIINSVYFKLIQSIGLTNVFYYRILSLLSFVVFWIVNLKIIERLGVKNQWLIFYLLITPYFIYFILGRGYGLSICFFSLALLYLLKYKSNAKSMYGYIFVISGVLSAISIFSFIYGFGALLILYLYYRRKNLLTTHVFIQMVFIILFIGYVYYAGQIILENGRNLIGGNKLIKDGTLSSIFTDFSYYYYITLKPINYIIKFLIITCLALPFIIAFIDKSRFNSIFLRFMLLFSIIIISILLMILSNSLFSSMYPYGRAVFYLHYILLLCIVVVSQNFSKKIYYLPLVIVTALSIYIYTTFAIRLFNPPLKELVEITDDNTILVISNNPSITLINQIHKIKDPSQILFFRETDEINDYIKKNVNESISILTYQHLLSSLEVEPKEILPTRDGRILVHF